MKIHLRPINDNSAGTSAPAPLSGELLAAIACHQPVRIRTASGDLAQTAPVLHHGTGWCSTREGAYTVDILAHSGSGREGDDERIDCDLSWNNEHHLIAALYHAQLRGVVFDAGVFRQKLGLTEILSERLATHLLDFEQEIRSAHACPAHQACAALRGMMSSLAYDWHGGLLRTTAADELVIIHHETDLLRESGKLRLKFLSVRHRGSITYCHCDEIPALDRELGDNMRRLRALIERWDEDQA